ncbi:MAG: hypothetical protein IJ268_06735 [Proteobacteria bacterium]|nr:hypothetical protein [Pseudomonadota bacterium]
MNTRSLPFFSIPLLLLISCAACFCGCAGTSANDTYEGYVRACQKENTDKAAQYLANPDTPDPCPDPDTARDLPSHAELFMRADVGSGQLTSEQDKWRVLIPPEFEPNTPFLFYYALKTALKTKDHIRLAKLLPTEDARNWPEKDLKTWLESAEANDLYAALSASPAPWFEIDGNRATCEAGGRHLTFEMNAGKWQVAKAVLTERQ